MKGENEMGKYRVNITFALTGSVEPEGEITGIVHDSEGNYAEFSDDSSYYGETVTVGGGEVSFDVEAEDEDAASEAALEAFNYHASFDEFGSTGIEWEIEDAEVNGVEALEEPMTLGRALELIEAYLDGELQSGRIDSETKAAFVFILAELMKLRAKEVATA